MRINKYLAQATGISRRSADAAITGGRVTVNGAVPQPGHSVIDSDVVALDGKPVSVDAQLTTIMLNKPVGYVCSRDGQGSKTIYDLLPANLHHLKPVGRLDKGSSGLLLMTDDGQLAHQLTHPSLQKQKVYQASLNKRLRPADQQQIQKGVELVDGISQLKLSGQGTNWTITMAEGRNRQIRRTFEALDYNVTKLHRTQFGPHKLDSLTSGKIQIL